MKLLKKPRKRTIVISAVAALLLVAAWFAWRALNGPVSGTVTPATTTMTTEKGTSQLGLNGQYFSVKYPGDFGQASNITQADPNSLEQYRLNANQHGTTAIVISISKLPTGGLSEVSSVKLRRLQKDVYAESAETYGPNKATVMTKVDGSEATAFIVHPPYLATIAVTSNSPDRDAGETLKGLASTFHWSQ